MIRLGSRAWVLAPAAGLLVVASCSLGLDEALIAKGGTAPPTVLPDGAPTGDSGALLGEGGVPISDQIPCTSDEPCKSDHPCLKGKCDLARKACTFDVCRASACNASACDTTARACGLPAPYKFKATQFALGTSILCARCAVAVHPWLYVATPLGLLAFNVANPASATPVQVPVIGLGFVPKQLVQAGSRVWALDASSGPNPSRVPVGYIDSPSNPFATKIVAQQVLATYNRAAAEGITLFGRGGDSALLVGPPASSFPATFIEPPIAEPYSLSASLTASLPTAFAAATSGKRILLGIPASALPATPFSFELIDNVGSQSPVPSPAVPMTATGNVSASRQFASSNDGAVVYATGVQAAGATPDVVTTRQVRGHFLVANDASPIDGTAPFDIETYDLAANVQGAGAAVVGPMAMVDAKTAIVPVAAREAIGQTAVQFIRREPLGVIKDGVAPRRQVLNVPITAFAAATSSNGIAYLVANDIPGPPVLGTVYAYDPACTQ